MIRKTYKIKLYSNKKNRFLREQITLSGKIYNHCIALHKRYYRLYGKMLPANKLKIHIAKLKRLPKYSAWKLVGSQAIQDVVERIDRTYQLFFSNKKRRVTCSLPKFKKSRHYKSFTLKQAGYRLLPGNKIRIQGKDYSYFKSQEIAGTVKTVTVKRDPLGDIYVFLVCETEENEVIPRTGKTVGYDFGLKTFLTATDGQNIEAPLFYQKSRNQLKAANQRLSSKQNGSKNRYKAKKNLARVHQRIANQRNDFQFKLAKQIAEEYAVICIEKLSLNAMKKKYGRKVSDLSFSSFVSILKHQCSKVGSTVVEIPRFYPSSQTCHVCEFQYKELTLRQRSWICPSCGTLHDRDHNAAMNILRVGASTLGVGRVRSTACVDISC